MLTACAFLLVACKTPEKDIPGAPLAQRSQFYEAECALGTQASDVEQFHALVHYPFEHSLRFPGMVIGIEKSADHLVKRGAEKAEMRQSKPEGRDGSFLFDRVFRDSKSMFISHVYQTCVKCTKDQACAKDQICVEDQASAKDQSNDLEVKALYNVYDEAKRIEERDAKPDSPVDCRGRPVNDLDAFGSSWNAIKQVKATLSNELARGHYTDLVVISMGWNTNQIEAVQNFNSLVHQLQKASIPKDQKDPTGKSPPPSVRPYVIGVTWTSEWTSPWLEPATRAVSLVNKANDADEVGAGWLGAIIRHGILEATQARKEKPLRVTVLGHSFGARATSMAVCRGTILKPPENEGFSDTAPSPGAVNWLVGLQGAYSLNRYFPEGAGLVHLRYAKDCPTAKRMLLTASKNDSAADISSDFLLSAPFAGQIAAWTRLQNSPYQSMFNFYVADAKGKVKPASTSDPAGSAPWNYIDATELVFYNAYGTGAGAHSDIYRSPMGELIWGFIK